MTTAQTVLVFAGIPLALAIVVFGLVSASSWTRSGRTTADYDADPFMVASDAAAPDPTIIPSDIEGAPVAGGGFSGVW